MVLTVLTTTRFLGQFMPLLQHTERLEVVERYQEKTGRRDIENEIQQIAPARFEPQTRFVVGVLNERFNCNTKTAGKKYNVFFFFSFCHLGEATL